MASQVKGQVGMSCLPKVALVTCAKATYQAATPQVMPAGFAGGPFVVMAAHNPGPRQGLAYPRGPAMRPTTVMQSLTQRLRNYLAAIGVHPSGSSSSCLPAVE